MGQIRRLTSCARPDWQSQADRLGYHYYRNTDGSFAWREDVRYEFDAQAVACVRNVAETLHRLCLEVVDEAVRRPEGLDAFHIPAAMQDVVRESWRRGDPFLIGRFDLAWCGGRPKLIEYNADTPATLPESTRMQDRWHQQCGGSHDHAPLDARALVERLAALRRAGRIGYMVHIVPYPDNLEDTTHAVYYREWAEQAGLEAVHCELRDLEVTQDGQLLHRGRIVRSMIRMYPWELMFRDSGARHLRECGCTFLNPPWTALLSNKALLPALWRRYPGHPNLLAAGYAPEDLRRRRGGKAGAPYVEKPIHSRGGENVRIIAGGRPVCAEGGTYGAYPRIFQEFADHRIDGVTASVGAWIVGERFAGLTMRESADPIVRHTSPIVPHLVCEAPGRLARWRPVLGKRF
ncbi:MULTISPECIES: glutathionylspermidine synthase family protein [Gluconobacter]|uniref:Glutathionylspermidine synthase family protein n=1 Tax=Gluconobacter cadivus TaxID=2728101 RepID=A0ABR9YU40_9PROT|nr:glutathionylspermidine synthase family protein [Gluconobacter cadivus]MBF0887829.1 glutathionylspermidine synthase family protein [Gluconobacter cadivus]MBS1058404.1 glutathionylspermidine synthase family protein [Gluconobacter sp. Dm-44]